MKMNAKPFGTLPDGSVVTCWSLTSDTGLRAEILDYGVTLRSLIVPDREGHDIDVVLGYDTLEEYCQNDGYLGATIGRFANRIGGASFELNGKTYPLAANDGPNHLHGGNIGFDKKIWTAQPLSNGISFSLTSPDGEEGYPGTLTITADITWAENGLNFRYHAETDQDTILNLTNHSYFNLNGSGDICDHILTIHADSFTPNDKACLPTGAVIAVNGTAMDFRHPKTIGSDIDAKEDCVQFTGGYDTNFILNGLDAATVYSPKTHIALTVTTDQPGMHLYTANFLSQRRGKAGSTYAPRSGLCLETQHYPDSIHHPEWPSCILRAGEVFDSFTQFSFHIILETE